MAGGSDEQKLLASLQRDVRAVCEEAGAVLDVKFHNFAVDLITELVYKKMQLFAVDLEYFAKHAKRSNINNEDVKLMVRRNPSIRSHLIQLVENNASSSSKENKKKKTTNASNNNANKNKNSEEIFRNQKSKKKDEEPTENTIDLT